MKKYKLTIIYNDITDEVEEIEEVVSDLSLMPRMLSIGLNNLLDYLTPEQYNQLNNSYNGDMYDA
jgi:hypothetical protein